MLITIQTDVPTKVILELLQLATFSLVELIDDTLKDIGQQVFASIGECRSDRAQVASLDDSEGLLHKTSSRCGNRWCTECRLKIHSPAQITQKPINAGSVRSALLHGPVIKFEVAREAAVTIFVRFLSHHDLVDESARQRISRDQPWHINAAESPLKHLEQRHEIPYGKHVVFHEMPQDFDAIHLAVNTMTEQSLSQRIESFFNFGSVVQVASPFDFETVPSPNENQTKSKNTSRICSW